MLVRPAHTRPSLVVTRAASADDPRVHDLLQPWDGTTADIALLGVPFDAGVVLGGGRAGARHGPDALRSALARFGTTWDAEQQTDLGALVLRDGGDVIPAGEDVALTHDRVTAACRDLLTRSQVLCVIGGGNDASFASIRALMQQHERVAGINVDAHLDVREVVLGKISSGTPYRRVLSELDLPGGQLVEFGLHAHVNARCHYEWAAAQGVSCHTLANVRSRGTARSFAGEVSRLAALADGLFVSIDLDVFAGAHAPGVSAPGTEGFTPEEGRAIAFAAGAEPKLRLFELMELNPDCDVDGRTARLAACLFCAFLSGVASRGSSRGVP